MRTIREVIENAPKTLTKEYLQTLNSVLFYQDLEAGTDIDSIIYDLLLLVVNQEVSTSVCHFAIVILQKLSPIKGVSDILSAHRPSLTNVLSIIHVQEIIDPDIQELIKTLLEDLCNGRCVDEKCWQLLGFMSTVILSWRTLFNQDDVKRISALMTEWLVMSPSTPVVKQTGFRRSSSSLSLASTISDTEGISMEDFFTVLNYIPGLPSYFLKNVQVFSMLRSFLWSSCAKDTNRSKSQFSGTCISEDFSLAIREYCMKIIDQVDRRAPSEAAIQFQRACLIEAIHLFNIICLMDSGIVHSVFPIIRRIYDHSHSNVSKDPEAQDVAVLASAMQFFINHGSSVMHKPDNLYVHFFCELLNTCYKDNYISYEILQLMKENLSQLCYHSSVLEKYFPTFFKVLAWRPCTFVEDFLEILPAFLSQQTSVEVFYMLLDLPCLTAILVLMDSKSSNSEQYLSKDPTLIETLRKQETSDAVKLLLRKTSGINDSYGSVALLIQSLGSLATHKRVMFSAETVVPLLRRFFEVVYQYSDATVTTLLVPAILEKLSLLFPVPRYAGKVHEILSEALVQLFELHPETVFHCQKNIISYISHFKNYSVAEKSFIHMIWVVGEYVSVTYSSICRPEIVALFFESLESTTYEALSSLRSSSDENYLKLLSVSLTTLSKLAARNQDQVPRAVLCLTKSQNSLLMFGNDYKKNWKIIIERVSELLSILNSPNIAAIVLSPPKHLENGKLHRDSMSLPYVLRAITGIVSE